MISQPPHFLLFSQATDAARPTPLASRSQSSPEEPDAPRTGWHFVLCSCDGTDQLEAHDCEQGASRERLELLAVVRGLEALDQPSRVTLATPSGAIRRGLRFGLSLWRENHWQWERFGRMTPIKNADLWRRIDRAMEFHDIQCHHLRFDSWDDKLTGGARAGRGEPASLGHDTAAAGALGQRGGLLPVRPASSPAPLVDQDTLIGKTVRRLFSWCGLYRSAPSLVITAH